MAPIDLGHAAKIFGNDAGEDEDPATLASYFVDKTTFKSFRDLENRFMFVRARKGMGKSALLSKLAFELQRREDAPRVIFVKGHEILGREPMGSDPDVLVTHWRHRISSLVAADIGRHIGFAMRDDEMDMVELAEVENLKGRNIVSSLLDRMKLKVANVEFEKKRSTAQNPSNLLKTYASAESLSVLLVIDDIDATFEDTIESRTKLATFFYACRSLVSPHSGVKGLLIRVAIRSDVWESIRRSNQSLDQCDQYEIDLSWTSDEQTQILVNKVRSYILLHDQDALLAADESVLLNVFVPRMTWSDRRVPPQVPIIRFSAGRPRWAGQLCRLAAVEAHRLKATLIDRVHIVRVLPEFGKKRLDDLYAEYRNRFPDLRRVIELFSQGPRKYTTRELYDAVAQHLAQELESKTLKVDGDVVTDAMKVCRFLFKVDFINLRVPQGKGDAAFVRYENQKDHLYDASNVDDGKEWEIHPTYRLALEIH